MPSAAVATAEVRADSDRIKDEIHALVLRNTRLQREIMTLNTGRERAAVAGIQMAHELTTELAALDDELRHVRAQCDAMTRELNPQRSDFDLLGDQISTESSMSTTRFRRMSAAVLGNGMAPGKFVAPHEAPTTQGAGRSRGASIANGPKRRGSIMMRFTSALSAKKVSSGADDAYSSDDNKSVDIDEMPSPAPSLSPSFSPMSTKSSGGSSKALGRPPLQHSGSSSSKMLQYKAGDDKKSIADAHKEHLSNFRRSSRASRKVLDTSGPV
ncbi:hypothetical protein PybrP1_009886 [[Pythium] brassicae (nom. inval.)]|nr:hypothetical protein PybrP1_009886 [[Pythium] brassicae (nom. inval.)]